MIKRKDLVKQFELVTKQEIVNHQKSINATNILLEKFKEKLKDINCFLKKELSIIYKNFLKIETTFQKFIIKSCQEIKEIKKISNTVKYKFKIFKDSIEKRIQIIESHEYIDIRIENLDKKLILISREHNKNNRDLKEIIQRSLYSLNNQYKCECEKIILQISEKPSYIEELEDKLIKKLDLYRIDNEGLIKEISIFKKQIFISNKKIENLYTLNKRMKDNLEKIKVNK